MGPTPYSKGPVPCSLARSGGVSLKYTEGQRTLITLKFCFKQTGCPLKSTLYVLVYTGRLFVISCYVNDNIFKDPIQSDQDIWKTKYRWWRFLFFYPLVYNLALLNSFSVPQRQKHCNLSPEARGWRSRGLEE